jgi:Periplasmic copper-binding protein (NosD)
MQYQSRSKWWHLFRSIANRILLLSGLVLCSCNLHAKTLNVHCGSISKTGPTSITAALKLLDPSVPNKLNIFGTCNENVLIKGFNRLTFVGMQGASIVDASGRTAQTILVVDSTGVMFRQLTIDGGLVGVQCDSFSVCRFSGDVVANGSGGIQITQSRAELDGTLVRHTDNGLTSLDASSVRVDGGVVLDGNGTGVVVDGGSSFESFGATISNSSLAGIEVSEHAFISLSGTTISGNGNGIELVRHSSLHLGASNTITANTGYGIFLFDLSFATFDPGNSVTGNNRNGIGALDVACFPQYTATRGVFANTGGATTNCFEN